MGKLIIDREFQTLIGEPRPEEQAQLERNLLRDGRALDPLIVWRTRAGDVLVDGHHRYEICRRHRLPYAILPLEFASRDAALLWIDEHQAGRRNLTDAAYTYRLGKIYLARRRQGERTDLTSRQVGEKLETAEAVALAHGTSRRSVERAAEFARAVDAIGAAAPELKAALLAERIKLAHADVVELSQHPATIARAAAHPNLRSDGATLRSLLRDARRFDRYGALALAGTPGPGERWGRFSVVLADPPWDCRDDTPWAARDHYATMPVADLIALRDALQLDEHLTADAALFLWANQISLPAALTLIEGWGFAYRTGLVWVKRRAGTGYYVRGQHELLLLATRGSLTPPEVGDSRPASVFTGEPWARRHSAKPVAQYELIERMYPGLPKLELFARRRRVGWAAWGNELGRYEPDGRRETGRRAGPALTNMM